MRSLALDMHIWRATYRIDQETAAQLAGVTARTWGRWERQESRPSEDHFETVNYLISYPPPWWGGSPGELADAPQKVRA